MATAGLVGVAREPISGATAAAVVLFDTLLILGIIRYL